MDWFVEDGIIIMQAFSHVANSREESLFLFSHSRVSERLRERGSEVREFGWMVNGFPKCGQTEQNFPKLIHLNITDQVHKKEK